MKLISARLGHDRYDTAACTAVLRVVHIRQHLELLNRLHGGYMDNGAVALHVADAVEKDFVLAILTPIDRHSGGAADVEGTEIPPVSRLDYARRRPGELKRVAALRRNVGNELVGNHLRPRRGFRLQQ